jgi:4-oxalocrotonate tautomerase family enzyme
MPWVTINLIQKLSATKKRQLHKAVAKTISGSLNIPAEYVQIQLVEMTTENHSIGGKSRK